MMINHDILISKFDTLFAKPAAIIATRYAPDEPRHRRPSRVGGQESRSILAAELLWASWLRVEAKTPARGGCVVDVSELHSRAFVGDVVAEDHGDNSRANSLRQGDHRVGLLRVTVRCAR